MFSLGNILDILGIKENLHSDYKLRPMATFIYIVQQTDSSNYYMSPSDSEHHYK